MCPEGGRVVARRRWEGGDVGWGQAGGRSLSLSLTLFLYPTPSTPALHNMWSVSMRWLLITEVVKSLPPHVFRSYVTDTNSERHWLVHQWCCISSDERFCSPASLVMSAVVVLHLSFQHCRMVDDYYGYYVFGCQLEERVHSCLPPNEMSHRCTESENTPSHPPPPYPLPHKNNPLRRIVARATARRQTVGNIKCCLQCVAYFTPCVFFVFFFPPSHSLSFPPLYVAFSRTLFVSLTLSIFLSRPLSFSCLWWHYTLVATLDIFESLGTISDSVWKAAANQCILVNKCQLSLGFKTAVCLCMCVCECVWVGVRLSECLCVCLSVCLSDEWAGCWAGS